MTNLPILFKQGSDFTAKYTRGKLHYCWWVPFYKPYDGHFYKIEGGREDAEVENLPLWFDFIYLTEL